MTRKTPFKVESIQSIIDSGRNLKDEVLIGLLNAMHNDHTSDYCRACDQIKFIREKNQ